MNKKYRISILVLSSVVLISGFARADTLKVQTNNQSILSRTTSSNYSIQMNGANAHICVNGTCQSYFNCPALTMLALPQNALKMTLPSIQAAKVLCNSRVNPTNSPREFRSPATLIQVNKGGTNSTTIYRSQTSNNQGGVTQIYSQQSTVISH